MMRRIGIFATPEVLLLLIFIAITAPLLPHVKTEDFDFRRQGCMIPLPWVGDRRSGDHESGPEY